MHISNIVALCECKIFKGDEIFASFFILHQQNYIIIHRKIHFCRTICPLEINIWTQTRFIMWIWISWMIPTKTFICARKVFLPVIFNLIQIFTGIRHWRMKTKLKILAAEFKRESYKFILNNCAVFTEMTLYRLFANLMTLNSITSF